MMYVNERVLLCPCQTSVAGGRPGLSGRPYVAHSHHLEEPQEKSVSSFSSFSDPWQGQWATLFST